MKIYFAKVRGKNYYLGDFIGKPDLTSDKSHIKFSGNKTEIELEIKLFLKENSQKKYIFDVISNDISLQDKNRSYVTAKKRVTYSAPLQWLLNKKLVPTNAMILDYGSGRGDDVGLLQLNGFNAEGYDPYYDNYLNYKIFKYDIVLCTYVLNVVTLKQEKEILKDILNALTPGGRCFVTVRRDLSEPIIYHKGYVQRMSYPNLYSIYKNSNFEIYSNIQ